MGYKEIKKLEESLQDLRSAINEIKQKDSKIIQDYFDNRRREPYTVEALCEMFNIPTQYVEPQVSETPPELTQVVAPAAGTIFAIRNWATVSHYGNFLVIQHDDGRYTLLGHLESIEHDITEGTTVTQGTLVAIAGNTGTVPNMAAHLHWSVFEDISRLHSSSGNNGMFLGTGWIVNTAKTINPQTLVDDGAYIHPSHGIIKSAYGPREMPPPWDNHEGIDY